jgi:hypothetical protein
MLSKPINIHSEPSILQLNSGKYHVYILGGWYVVELLFFIRLKSVNNKKLIEVKNTKWRVQSFEHGKRAKRYYEFEIIEPGKYELSCLNPETLMVKKNNLPISRFLMPFVDNKNLEILILKA